MVLFYSVEGLAAQAASGASWSAGGRPSKLPGRLSLGHHNGSEIGILDRLVACIHRLARLQTTREMRPRPERVDRRERAIDRLIVAARRVLTLEGSRR